MRQAQPPYVIAYVTLEEGPTMMTNIVECDVAALRVGLPVEVAIRQQPDGDVLPMFKPA
jgi:uncharacterized OB-fold protein